jgi:hypothetical protein
MTSPRSLEEQLPELFERAAPQPPRDLDGTSIRAAATHTAIAQPRSWHSLQGPAWRWAAPAAAMVIVIVVTVTATLLADQRSRDHNRAITTPAGIPALNAQRRADTASALHQLLAAFSVPSTWRESTRSLSKDLALPTDDPTTYYVSRARLWTTSDAANAAMAYLSSHLPPDVTAGNAGAQTPRFASALFTPTGQWTRSSDYAGMEISVVIERLRSGAVGVEIGASAYWLPLRTSAQTIPASVTGATVTIKSSPPSQKIHRAYVNAADARTLADQINHLAVTYQAPSLCPMPGRSATVIFTSPVGSQKVDVSTFCPSGVFVHPRGVGMTIDLAPARVFATVLAILHLPADFEPR